MSPSCVASQSTGRPRSPKDGRTWKFPNITWPTVFFRKNYLYLLHNSTQPGLLEISFHNYYITIFEGYFFFCEPYPPVTAVVFGPAPFHLGGVGTDLAAAIAIFFTMLIYFFLLKMVFSICTCISFCIRLHRRRLPNWKLNLVQKSIFLSLFVEEYVPCMASCSTASGECSLVGPEVPLNKSVYYYYYLLILCVCPNSPGSTCTSPLPRWCSTRRKSTKGDKDRLSIKLNKKN